MSKQTPHSRSHTRAVLLAAIAVTNVLSFVMGVSAAGKIAIRRSSRTVAAVSPSASPTAKRTAKPAAATKASTAPRAKNTLASAAVAGARAGGVTTKPAMPIAGKGMWIYQFDMAHGGDPRRIVRAAVRNGISHLYVRSGSTKSPLSGWRNIKAILPVAHRAGIKVIAWDFPYLFDPPADARRGAWVMKQNVRGHTVDGFAADVETRHEGTKLTRNRAAGYARHLRWYLPDEYLILVPPRPTKYVRTFYPYKALAPSFDAIAPMVYWGRFRSDATVRSAIQLLRSLGKPIVPIGQSFDMGPEGGPKGAPSNLAVLRFMRTARSLGAPGVSFWSWQHTPRRLWRTIDGYQWPVRPGAR